MGFPRPPTRLGSTPVAPATGRAFDTWRRSVLASGCSFARGPRVEAIGRSLVAMKWLEPRSGEDLRARRRAGARADATRENPGFCARYRKLVEETAGLLLRHILLGADAGAQLDGPDAVRDRRRGPLAYAVRLTALLHAAPPSAHLTGIPPAAGVFFAAFFPTADVWCVPFFGAVGLF